MTNDRFEEISAGDEAEIIHTITARDVDAFAQLTGDYNPLHMDDAYAAGTSFRKRVVHGMLTASFISNLIGTKLPGAGALWYEQHLRFLAPVRVGEKIRVWAKVLNKSHGTRILTLQTRVFADGNREILDGEAKIKVLPPEVKDTVPENSKGAVIVSGGSGGIGAGVAREMGLEGFPVVVNYCRSQTAAASVVDSIVKAEGKAAAFGADLRDCAQVTELVRFALEQFGDLAGIVHCAAPSLQYLDFSELTWETIEEHLEVQVKGAFHLARAAVPHLIKRKRGTIVTITSISSDNIPPAKLMHYSLAKSALTSLTKSLALELGPCGIRANCVSPGMTRTDFIADLPEKVKMVTKMQTPLRRLASPEDIAGVVAFLFSEKAAHITGEILRVCGGATMV